MKEIETLKKIKKRRGISLETMSKEIGINSRTLFRWFHGEDKPSIMGKSLIANYLKGNGE